MSLEPSGTLEHVEDEAFVVVKAAPRASQTHGVTVCCAAIDRNGKWVRLYPVSFQTLEEKQKFARWDRLRYRWRKPRVTADRRSESRRVDAQSIRIEGSLPERQRHPLINRTAVTSLQAEGAEGRSLARLRAEILDFRVERRSASEIAKEQADRAKIRAQVDMFSTADTVAADAIPFVFKYKYRDDDGEHIGTCQDWETEATFLRRRRDLGSERAALDWMQERFGVEWPAKGIVLAMGTHRWHPGQWLINGIVRVDADPQTDLF
ncbi:hypothetical protein [uncultured Sphingomonas sp.]|uniref:hypothetical protein n=1 Tax=uncultured Sphingomonas sp. TaxID=158754 RepID=UPI0035C9E300